jgi:AraC-like DNA-binding protein
VGTAGEMPIADRDALRESFLRIPAPTQMYGAEDDEFTARVNTGDLGPLTFTALSCRGAAGHGLRRDAKLIRRSDPHQYVVVLNQREPLAVSHHHHQAILQPDELVVFDTSLPHDGWRRTPGDMLHLTFAQELLPVSRRSIDPLVGAPLSVQTGIGALLRTFMNQAVRDSGHYDPADATRVSTVLLDLVSGLLAHERQDKGILPAESGKEVLFQQILAFIQGRLGDPDLTPTTVAEAHHISVRALHRLFESRRWTVAAWIRERRLERCRRDLADPALSDKPISRIAARWGFRNAAHFTRAFRSAYELSPQDYRSRAFPGITTGR